MNSITTKCTIQSNLLKILVYVTLVVLTAGCDAKPESAALITATNSKSTSTPIPKTINVLESYEDVSRFMARSGFGATSKDLIEWKGRDAADWLLLEFNKPSEPLLQKATLDIEAMGNIRPPFRDYIRYSLHRGLIESNSILRTKTTYALSQILVVGGELISGGFQPYQGITYHDILNESAFGNYQDILFDIAYSPAMAKWLTYLRNEPGNDYSGREPDENFARELMQLFTIGLHELRSDGTAVTDSGGNPIPTYNNNDVAQLARVFTGFSYDHEAYYPSNIDYRTAQARPLRIFSEHHSQKEKYFLEINIPAGIEGDASVRTALKHIFNHKNTAPFISRQLIQRFSASHPDPEYVHRVSSAFESGLYVSANETYFGSGRRGDLTATIAAILLDHSLYEDRPSEYRPTKVREPLLNYINFMRTFDINNLENINITHRLSDLKASNSLGMAYFESPSVFGFYRPGYIPPMSEAGDRNMTVPEFQLTNSSTTTGYINLMTELVMERLISWRCPDTPNNNFKGLDPCNNAKIGQQFKPNYETEMQLAKDPTALTQHLNTLLLAGRMPKEDMRYIADTINISPVSTNTEREDIRRRVHIAVLMFVTSPYYTILN